VWASGELVTLRYRSLDGRFHEGHPVRVIEHTPELVVTFMPIGTVVSYPALADGRGLRDLPLHERWAHPRVSATRPWHSTEVIQLFPKGRAHSLWVMRDSEHSLLGWYVNLEDPQVLGARTISTRDHVLDLWVPADTGEPEWKDEDELAAAVEAGRFTAAEAASIRAEGERVWAERPWPTGWEEWLPPSEWAQPELPDGWNED
jgi:hypothetical protein